MRNNVCFVVANVSQPILGLDFLSNHNIIVDCKNSMLVDAETGIRVSCEAARRTMPISFGIDGAPLNDPFTSGLGNYLRKKFSAA